MSDALAGRGRLVEGLDGFGFSRSAHKLRDTRRARSLCRRPASLPGAAGT